jgi:hypothetical protein
MSNLDEGNAFLGDVSSSVRTLTCRFCKATKYYIHECHNVMRVLFFCMMLIIMYIFCCTNITK